MSSNPLSVGAVAPDFALRVTSDTWLSLGELKGKPLILAFYPEDWGPACTEQITVLNQAIGEFHRREAEMLGISVDSVWCHSAFAIDRRLQFPLLSDFEPKGEVARRYGAYRENEGVCECALFVIDRKGFIFWSYCSPIAMNLGAEEILDVLNRLERAEDPDGDFESNAA